jgi:uncharacterized protein YbjQ (UPF0145 family)
MQMSTTDTIPGEQRAARESMLTWSGGHKSIQEAYDGLEKWMKSGGWHACVGVRFEAHPKEDYSVVFTGTDRAWLRWTVYGTAVKFA